MRVKHPAVVSPPDFLYNENGMCNMGWEGKNMAETEKTLTKIVQFRINGFDGYVSKKEATGESAPEELSRMKPRNRAWKKAWDENTKRIDKAIDDFVVAKNKTISFLFIEFQRTEDYRNAEKENGNKLGFEEAWKKLHEGKKREASCYAVMSENLKGYLTGNMSESNRRLWTVFQTAVKGGLYHGRKSLPSFRDNAALDFRGDSVSVGTEEIDGEEKFFISLSIVPKGKIHCNLDITDREGNQFAILKRIYEGTYKAGTAAIVRKKGRYFVQLAYTFKVSDALRFRGMSGLERNLDPLRVLGVDLGLAKPLAMQPYDAANEKYLVSDKYANTQQFIDKWCVSGDRINNFRKQVEKKKFAKQHDLRDVSPGHTGKGRSKRVRPLDSYRDTIADFRKTTNYVYANRIVNTAKHYGCGTIQMEDLTIDVKGKKNERFLKSSWTYYDLQQKVEQKAAELGIVVAYIKPQFTSQRCSKCGHIAEENRPDQATFKCEKCGFEMNADLNAARNIAVPKIDEIIAADRKKK